MVINDFITSKSISRFIVKDSIDFFIRDKDLFFVTMTEYSPEIISDVAYPKTKIETTLAAEISKAGLSQVHIAETEKFAHATYFFNGGKHEPHENERHILVESRKDIPTHDLAPEMRAESIADEALQEIENGTDFIFINFANADMVGHTANAPAIIQGVEEIDKQLRRVVESTIKHGGVAMITADHGNAELNIDPQSGEKHTAHTLNLVPFIITTDSYSIKDKIGDLSDVAPTALKILGMPIPVSMTGDALIK